MKGQRRQIRKILRGLQELEKDHEKEAQKPPIRSVEGNIDTQNKHGDGSVGWRPT
jgi:hypothetical protein